MILKRSILIEGCDGSGKSTLFNKLTKDWTLPSAGHDGGPLRDAGEAWRRMADFAARSPAVRDRCPAISEVVYSVVLGRDPVIDEGELFEWLELFDPYVILCRPPTASIMSHPVEVRGYKSALLVEGITAMRPDIIRAYDVLLSVLMRRHSLKMYLYDWTQDPKGDYLAEALIEEGVCAA